MVAVVFSGTIGLVAIAKWIAWHHGLALTISGCAALFLIGLGLMRISAVRSFALAWTTAVGTVSAFVALLEIVGVR